MSKQLSKEEVELLKVLCKDDLYLFAIRYMLHFLKLSSSVFHKYLYKILTEEYKKERTTGFKYAIAAPRGNAKSSIISTIFPLWCIAYNKKDFIIIVSDTASQAEDFLSDIKRELEHNSLLLRDFPQLAGKGEIWRADRIVTANQVRLLSLGTGSKIRGRRFGIHRPDLLIFDDLESSEMVRSLSEREYVRFQWFNKDALKAGGEEGSCTDMLIVGTILGKDSLLEALLDPGEYPDWKSKRFSAVKEFAYAEELWDKWESIYKDRFNEDRKEDALKFYEDRKKEMLEGAEVLWPEGDPYYSLMIDKISDLSAFMSEKQNNPLDPTKILVMKDDLRFENFQSNPVMQEILSNKRNPWYGSLDPSLGKKTGRGDYSCIVTLVRCLNTGHLLIVNIDLERRKVDDQIESILSNHSRFNYNMFAVETNAFQHVVAENLRKLSKLRGAYIPIKNIDNFRDKKMRIESIVPLLKDGTIIFDSWSMDKIPQYDKGVEQLTTFTGDGDRHDDMPDSLEMSVRLASSSKFKLRTRQTRR